MEGQIQFVANYDDWRVVKKQKIDDSVPRVDIMDFLASISISFEDKINDNLIKSVSIEPVEEYISSLVKGKLRKEEDFATMLKGLASPNAGKAITKCIPEEMEKAQKEKFKIYLKVYMMRKALLTSGLMIDYSKLPIMINKKKKKK